MRLFKRKYRTQTEKLVGRLEKALSRDLGPTFGHQKDGWLLDRHHRYLHVVTWEIGAYGEVTITLKPAHSFERGNYVEGQAAHTAEAST